MFETDNERHVWHCKLNEYEDLDWENHDKRCINGRRQQQQRETGLNQCVLSARSMPLIMI